ncbi:unnamed protein product [Amoebophrya sp. A25]|nr:unnamed protein product [Amoebophrya sp. A25]|eukprot:GSA25T00009452001.1
MKAGASALLLGPREFLNCAFLFDAFDENHGRLPELHTAWLVDKTNGYKGAAFCPPGTSGVAAPGSWPPEAPVKLRDEIAMLVQDYSCNKDDDGTRTHGDGAWFFDMCPLPSLHTWKGSYEEQQHSFRACETRRKALIAELRTNCCQKTTTSTAATSSCSSLLGCSTGRILWARLRRSTRNRRKLWRDWWSHRSSSASADEAPTAASCGAATLYGAASEGFFFLQADNFDAAATEASSAGEVPSKFEN